MPPPRRVAIHSDRITLGGLLKLARVAATGGEAKQAIQGGRVTVNGAVERRRGRQVRPGDRVEVDGTVLEIERSA